jgi:hypothetical protein
MPEHFSYRLMAEYESRRDVAATAGVSLRDAYIRWANGKWSATAGQYKTPFSREYLMSISTLETPTVRAREPGPKRDIGVVAEYLLVPDLTVSAGVFNGEGQNASFNRDSTVMFVGRIAGVPLPHVQLGLAGTASGSDSTRIGLEAGVDYGGFSARGEYMRLKRDAAGTRDEGWYGLASYRVGRRALARVAPGGLRQAAREPDPDEAGRDHGRRLLRLAGRKNAGLARLEAQQDARPERDAGQLHRPDPGPLLAKRLERRGAPWFDARMLDDPLFRLFLATLLGGAIGWERFVDHKPAGPAHAHARVRRDRRRSSSRASAPSPPRAGIPPTSPASCRA